MAYQRICISDHAPPPHTRRGRTTTSEGGVLNLVVNHTVYSCYYDWWSRTIWAIILHPLAYQHERASYSILHTVWAGCYLLPSCLYSMSALPLPVSPCCTPSPSSAYLLLPCEYMSYYNYNILYHMRSALSSICLVYDLLVLVLLSALYMHHDTIQYDLSSCILVSFTTITLNAIWATVSCIVWSCILLVPSCGCTPIVCSCWRCYFLPLIISTVCDHIRHTFF